MTVSISKRGLVRLVSFALAVIVILSLLAYQYAREASHSQRALEYHYIQSVNDLSTYVQNIDSDLTKAMYAGTPSMLSGLSSKIWRETGFAKDALDSLPIEYLKLQNTNKLLSQVGDYCVSLSKSFARGEDITEEQRQNLVKLHNYCESMLSEVLAVNDGIQTGSISLTSVKGNINREFDSAPAMPSITEGFSEFEEGFTAYPSLIYDGPFSDHIMQREPEFLKGQQDVTRAAARKKAAKVSGISEASLKDGNDEEGKMPSYSFESDGIDISVTKKGGLLSYLLRSRMVENRRLSVSETLKSADAYLKSLGITDLSTTYYEISNNIMTINYAYENDSILFYTDLVKLSVAMDNGEIVGFDSRGFLTNHHTREKLSPKLSMENARRSLSSLLKVEKSRLCMIPSGGLNEVLCWEFQCTSKDGKDILVYINADTGMEEQILILLVSENGQLTI